MGGDPRLGPRPSRRLCALLLASGNRARGRAALLRGCHRASAAAREGAARGDARALQRGVIANFWNVREGATWRDACAVQQGWLRAPLPRAERSAAVGVRDVATRDRIGR